MRLPKIKILIICIVASCFITAIVYAPTDYNVPQQSTTGPVPPKAVQQRDMMVKMMGAPANPVTIAGVPDYSWRHGCGPTAVGMVVGYYDGKSYSDLITGDASTETNDVKQAIASGGTSGNKNPPGSEKHYEDYSCPEDDQTPNMLTDDYITKGRQAHADDCIGDYMDTSKSTRNNRYGWSWSNDIGPSFTGYVNQQNATYNPTYTEYRWGNGTLTWAVLTNEIDNGRPMVFLVDSDGDGSTDHFVTIVGYDTQTNQYGCHDTWAPAGIRWQTFQGIGNGAWSIWGGWAFQLAALGEQTKYEQPPDATDHGMDIRCDRRDGINRVLADDFPCETTGPITKVKIWGSWLNDLKGTIQTIHLSIHSDDPCGLGGTDPCNIFSKPDTLLWSKDVSVADINELLFADITPDYEWWWDVANGQPPTQYGDHQIWQYDINIDPCQAFVQDGNSTNPKIYWLDVYVVINAQSPPGAQFGWKTSVEHWMDDSVWSNNSGSTWHELKYPPTHQHYPQSLDFAFAIITGESNEPNEPNETAKWAQPPDATYTGMDIRCDRQDQMPRVLADDFQCTATGAITKVKIWGSWKNDGKGQLAKIHLSIHSDDPAGAGGTDPCNTFSKPDTLLWSQDFFPVNISEKLFADLTPEYEWWWDPIMQQINMNGDHKIWQYDITVDPCEAFVQEGTTSNPIVYWLDVYVLIDGNYPSTQFGWKTSLQHWNDDGVWSGDNGNMWHELRYPTGHPDANESIDFAFAIITSTEPNEPNEPNEQELSHLKWSQPPIPINPLSQDIIFCGWDEKSYNKDYSDPLGPCKMVADDFRCIGSMPITSVHWWGSYYGWEDKCHPPPAINIPIAWHIGFWTNVAPMSPPYFKTFSFPEILIHGFTIPAGRVTSVQVGQDQYFGQYPNDVCYKYSVSLEPNEIFDQNDFISLTEDKVFWLSITAIYDQNQTESPYYPWGWKSRPWHWMDDAVTFNMPTIPMEGVTIDPNMITTIKDPQFNESFDMAFELDTDPNYIKWEQPFTGIRNWPNYEDENSIATEDSNGDVTITSIAADDWRCVKRTPITAIVWWGSYIGYHYQACSSGGWMPMPVRPDYFLLNIWKDIPSDGNDPNSYSKPGQKIWQFKAYNFDQVLVGYDGQPPTGPNEPVFRYSVRLPADKWFCQRDYNDIFWLSIAAVYIPGSVPNYVWGWTNHKHGFNDGAVSGTPINPTDQNSLLDWQLLKDSTNSIEDMSFILFTDPYICCTCADYNYDNIVDFKDFAEFALDWRWTGSVGGFNNSDLDCSGTVDWKDIGVFAQNWLGSCP